MNTKLIKALRQVALGGALAAVATSGMAATQGNVGFTSVGDIDITLNINDEVRISNLTDVILNFTSTDVTGTSGACIYRNGGADYQITATGDGAAGAFTLANGPDTVPYSVSFNDGSGASAMTSGSALAQTNAVGADDNCVTNGSDNGTITIGVLATDANPLPQAAYTGTLTLLVAPN